MIGHNILRHENLLSTGIIKRDVEGYIGREMEEYMIQIMKDMNEGKYKYFK